MWQRNNGKGEVNILQNKFTRFLLTTIDRDKATYLDRQLKKTVRELPTEQDDIKSLLETDLHMWESLVLEEALGELTKRDCYILLARVLERKSYDDLANELGLGYKGVAAAYYRALHKLRCALRGE